MDGSKGDVYDRLAIVALGAIWLEDAAATLVPHAMSAVFSSPTGACDCWSGFGRSAIPKAAPGSRARSRLPALSWACSAEVAKDKAAYGAMF